MKTELAQEIIHCLPEDRTLFHYYKDYYAVYLLQREIMSAGIDQVAQLKRCRYANLTAKPVIKSLLANRGSGEISAEDFETLWSDDYETYVLTLGSWGQTKDDGYFQTSRPGTNIVLQLNFSRRHDQRYRRCFGDELDLFSFSSHPISPHKTTLAWARIDLDFNTDEALIEEIQNDWLRRFNDFMWDFRYAVKQGHLSFDYFGMNVYVDRAFEYYQYEIKPQQDIWSEAMLSATLKFLLDEIGIKTVYYHSDVTGAAMKRIHFGKPPRSLYSKLPNQFCFNRVTDAPAFLAKDKSARRRLRKIKNQQWFRMET